MLDTKWMRTASRMSSAVIVKVLLLAGGFFLGEKIDSLLGTQPIFQILLMCVGVGVGIWWILFNLSKK